MNETIITVKRALLPNCAIGTWTHKGEIICYSVEKPWLSNRPFESCVPAGKYKIKRISTDKHPDSFYLENELLGVSWSDRTPRTNIMIHVANFPYDVVGCLGPGLDLHSTKWGVARSKDAMKMLNYRINNDNWILNIEQ